MIEDVCQSLQYKQWQTFRAKNILWGSFLKAKYCQRSNPVRKKWDIGESLVQRHMMMNKINIEHLIHQKNNSSSCSFWRDNWLGVGPLTLFRDVSSRLDNTKVSTFIMNGQWDVDMVISIAHPQDVASILAFQLQIHQNVPDKPLWKLNVDCNFTTFLAWNIISQQKTKTKINRNTWHKDIPFKYSFLLRRAIRGKLPLMRRSQPLVKNEELVVFVIAQAGILLIISFYLAILL